MRPLLLKLFVTGLLCIVVGSGCSSESSSQEFETLNLAFEEEFILPDPALAKDSVVFSFPARVRTGDDGKIYVTDRKLKTVRVFDENGNLINSLGRPGRGPGEFGDLGPMDVTSQNELVVFDAQEDRVNRFSGSGEFLTSIIPPQNGFTWPDKIRQIDSGQFLFLSRERSIRDADDTPLQTSFLHIYDAGFENRLSSFGHIDSLMESVTDFARVFTHSFGQGNITVDENGSVWYVPTLYEGRIFRFGEIGNGWKLTGIFHGHMIADGSHENGYDEKADGAAVIHTYTPEGRNTVSALIKSQSLGIYELEDGRMIHLNAQLVDTTRKIRAEVFSAEGNLQGVGELPRFNSLKSDRDVDITFAWKDEQDRFYIRDDEEGAPIIRVGKIAGL